MTKEELKKYAYNKIKELNKSLYIENSELEFYEDFFKENKFSDKRILLNLSSAKLLIAFLGQTGVCEDFDRMKSDCIGIAQVLKNAPYEELLKSIQLSENYINEKPRNERLKKKMFSRYKVGEREILNYFLWLNVDLFSQTRLTTLAKYINEYEAAMIDSLIVASPASMINGIKEAIDKRIPRDTSEKERNNRYFNAINNQIDFKKFQYCIGIIRNHFARLKNEETERVKAIQRDIRGYEKLYNDLDKLFEKEEITDYKVFLKSITDEALRIEVLKMVYDHNKEYYEKIDKEHKLISEDTKLHYYALLQKEGIDKEDVDIYQIMQRDYDSFVESLKELKKISEDKEFIIKGLQESNLDRIKEIVSFKDKGYIDNNSIYENADILELDSEKFDKLTNSIEYINSKNINPGIFIKEAELLMNDENIKEKFKLLEKENLLNQLKNTESFEFFNLDTNTLEEKIAKLHDVDLYRFIREDLDILNLNNYNRAVVLKDIDYNIETKEELVEILSDDSFLIPDERVEEYVSKTK
jgi:hypothetical protein